MEKISLIIYYDEERSLQECVYYLQKLQVPEGFETEFLYVKDAENLDAVRNEAIQKRASKYKVYLDQNTLIINNFFLYEILSRFKKKPEIGMLGVWGSGINEENNLGRILLWSEEEISEVNYVSDRKDEAAINVNGVLIATQYDLEWSEYQKVIPYQDSCWCIYDCRSDKGTELEREYRYQLLRAEIFHDAESREMIGSLLKKDRLNLQQQIQRAENQAFAKTIMGYYWEDFYCSTRKWKKYLPADGKISLERDANKEMNIVMSFNHGYVRYAQVMLQSLYENNGLVNICVHVLQCDLSAEDKELLRGQAKEFEQSITFYDFDRSLLPEEIRTTEEWSVETYFRLFMTDILPVDVKRLLYLDVDVIVNKPIYDFYYMDMQGYEIVGCRDFSLILQEGFHDKRKELFSAVSEDERFVYINAGVMLVNLEQIRKRLCAKDYVRTLQEQKEKLFALDQDIINLMHWQNIGLVDEYRYDFFNACFKGLKAEEVKQHVSIIHYAGPKPWMPIDTSIHAHRIWWEYANLI